MRLETPLPLWQWVMNECKPFCPTTLGEILESISVLRPHPRPIKSESLRVGPKQSKAIQMAFGDIMVEPQGDEIWCISNFFLHKNIWEARGECKCMNLLLEILIE